MATDRESILIVDDDHGVLSALNAELCEHYTVMAVNSAEQALANLHSRDFAAIVSDVRMPGIDGLSLIEQCAVRYPNMVRLILTAFDGEEVHNAALGPNGAFKLVKPWGDDLLITLQNALAQRSSQMALRHHLSLKAEALDMDRWLHPDLEERELIRRAASVMTQLPEVVAATLYFFGEDDVSTVTEEMVSDSGTESTESVAFVDTNYSPIGDGEHYLYSISIGELSNPSAGVALRLSNNNDEVVHYLDFIGRTCNRSLALAHSCFVDNNQPACDDDLCKQASRENMMISTDIVLEKLVTPATVLTSLTQNLRELSSEVPAINGIDPRVAQLSEKLEEMASDLEEVNDTLSSFLTHARKSKPTDGIEQTQ